jgi:hypothetical protein
MAALAFRGIIVGCARTMAVWRSGTASSFACYAFHPGRHSLKILIENPYRAFRTAAEFARWSGWSCPRRMSASISRSRSSIPRNRNPLRRRSRCRSIRAADVERDGSLVAGGISAVPRSSAIVHPVAGRICFLFTSRKISKCRGGGMHRMTLHQNGRLARSAAGRLSRQSHAVGDGVVDPIV